LICQLTLFSATLVCTAAAQTGPQLGFVNKLGTEVDVRSGGRILADDIASSKVILPDLAVPNCPLFSQPASAPGTRSHR
jgi:hypothetical protein